jgi:hypothetical protein
MGLLLLKPGKKDHYCAMTDRVIVVTIEDDVCFSFHLVQHVCFSFSWSIYIGQRKLLIVLDLLQLALNI